MNKIIPILAILVLPLSAQALVIAGNGSTTASDGTSSDIHTDVTITGGVSSQDGSTTAGTDAAISADVVSAVATNATTTVGSNIPNALMVNTDSDLSTYNDSILSSNENVAAVDTTTSDSVAVEYTHHAKLFGFIPVHINSKTMVTTGADGSAVVKTTFPWWKIFVSGVGDTSDTVDSSISASESAKAYVAAKTSAHAKAVLTETVVATLNAEAGVSLLGQ